MFFNFCNLTILHTDPRFPQTQNSVITREFCTASNNRKDFMFSYVEHVASSNHKARKCRFYISYRTNHTIIRVSYRVSRRYQNPAPHGTSNHSGIIRGSFRVSTRYQCSPAPMEQLIIQSLEFLIWFQEDMKIIIIVVIIFIIIIIIAIVVILACLNARCESGQISGSCRDIIIILLFYYINIIFISWYYYIIILLYYYIFLLLYYCIIILL